jgi:hypothetical protein
MSATRPAPATFRAALATANIRFMGNRMGHGSGVVGSRWTASEESIITALKDFSRKGEKDSRHSHREHLPKVDGPPRFRSPWPPRAWLGL